MLGLLFIAACEESKSFSDQQLEAANQRQEENLVIFQDIASELAEQNLSSIIDQESVIPIDLDSRKVVFIDFGDPISVSKVQSHMDPLFLVRDFTEETIADHVNNYDEKFLEYGLHHLAASKEEVGLIILISKLYDEVWKYEGGEVGYKTTVYALGISYPEFNFLGAFSDEFLPPDTTLAGSNMWGYVPSSWYNTILTNFFS